MALQVGDIVKLADDHTPVTRGEWYRVLDIGESPAYGSVAELMRVEHFPGPDWPRGALTHYRVLPVAWLRVDLNRTKSWREAVA
jgi:hypothetical protein